MFMTRRSLTMNHIVAWTVPLLLALLLIPTAPSIVTVVRTHFEVRTVRTTTTTRPAQGANSGDSSHTTTTDPTRATLVTTSPATPTKPATGTSPSTTTTTLATTTTTSAPSSGGGTSSSGSSSGSGTPEVARHGVLAPPYQEVQETVDPGTSWTVASDGVVSWALDCSNYQDSNNPPLITVPSYGVGCYVDISTRESSAVSWQLNPAT